MSTDATADGVCQAPPYGDTWNQSCVLPVFHSETFIQKPMLVNYGFVFELINILMVSGNFSKIHNTN